MSEKQLHRALIQLAQTKPGLRRHLVPLIRMAAATPEGAKSEFARYKQEHPGTQKKPQDFLEKSEGKNEGEGEGEKKPDLKSKLTGFLKSLSGAKASVKEAIKKAPREVQQFVVDPKTRSKDLRNIAQGAAKDAKSITKGLMASAGKELKELHHAVKASPKLFKKPPGPFSKEDKAAFYSAGAYVVGTVLAATPPGGALMAAQALGASFAKHVAIKAVSELMDKGFLHFEWAESVFHAGHMVLAAEGQKAKGPDTEAFLHGLVLLTSETLKKGVSEEDMKKLLSEESL